MGSSSSAVPIETERAMATEGVGRAESQLQAPSPMDIGPADQAPSGGVQKMEQQVAANSKMEGQLQAVEYETAVCVSKQYELTDTKKSTEQQSEPEAQETSVVLVEQGTVSPLDSSKESTEREPEVQEASVVEERTVSPLNGSNESTESSASCLQETQSTLLDPERTNKVPACDKHVPSTQTLDTSNDQLQDSVSEMQTEVMETLSPAECTLGAPGETPEETSNYEQDTPQSRESKMDIEVPDASLSAMNTLKDHSEQNTLKVESEVAEKSTATTVATSEEMPNCAKEESCSRDPTPEVGGVLTKAMVDEERRLRDGVSPGSANSVDDEVQELSEMKETQRFTRLQHLLEKSSIYSKFLLKRMENQKEQEQQQSGRKKKIVGQTTSTSAGGDHEKQAGEGSGSLESESASQESNSRPESQESSSKPESQESGSPGSGSANDSKAKKPGKRRGRKRKAECGSYKLSDYMDSQGQLKKRKLEKGESAPPIAPPTATPTAASKSVEEEVKRERYYNGQPIPARQPKLMTGGIMRSYQLDGMEWIKVLYENGVNGILADEMGLGKTIQCIGVVAHMIEMGVKGPFLVAAPLSTVPNWVEEFRKFTPSIPVVLYHGTIQEREQLRKKNFHGEGGAGSAKKGKGKPPSEEPLQPVFVTSYEICMKDQRFLMGRSWKFLVVDEGHRIKNLNCKLIRALKSYDAANRLLLTGTPLQNNLAELWSLLNFLLPDIFDDLNSFQSWFDFDGSGEDEMRERIIAQEREQNVLSTLHQILTPFLLRRLKMDVEFSLPPKKEVLVYAPLTTTQQRYYKSLLDKTIMEMVETERMKKLEVLGKENTPSGEEPQGEGEGRRLSARKRRNRSRYSQLSDTDFESLLQGEVGLEEIIKPEQKEEEKKVITSALNIKMTNVFMMLRKCCNHPYLLEFPMTPEGQFQIDEELIHGCGKIMLLDRLVPALIRDGHKMLVFSQFTMMLDILEDFLELRGLSYSRLDGTMGFTERQRQMTIFREDPDCHIFLLSTRAGGLGINLTAADTVIIYDSDWNPQADLQAQDRCHRIGQTKPVMVYRLVTANTIDQRIVERAAGKRRLEKMVIHKGKFKGYSAEEQQLSLEDLMELLQSVDHERVVGGSDAVISDRALTALLDRSFTSKKVGAVPTRAEPKTSRHEEVFKVLEERDIHGNILRSVDAEC